MKRGPLERRTPIRRRTWLATKAELRRGKARLARRTSLKAKGGDRFPGRRDEAFKAHVRTQPCLLAWTGRCWGPVDPHHTEKKSHGGHDRTCVPMCRGHHDEVEQTPTSVYRLRYPGLDFATESRRILATYQELAT